MSFVSQTTILFSRKKVYGVSECVFLVRGFATDWRYLVARGNFSEAWEILDKGYDNNVFLVGIVDDHLSEMLMDPKWLNQYQAFRNWVWSWKNVWLADSWSMRISNEYPIFGFQNAFMLEGSAKCFEGAFWLLDVDFVVIPSAGYGMAVSRFRVLGNDDRDLWLPKDVSSPVDLVFGVVSTLVESIALIESNGWKSPSTGDPVLSLFGNGDTSVFIPSPGALVYFDLAVSDNNNELCDKGIEVRNGQGKSNDGSSLLNIDIVFPDSSTRFCFSGRDAFKDLSGLYETVSPPWYHE